MSREGGKWRLERQCGDCGHIEIVGGLKAEPPVAPMLKPGPNCKGYFNGRPHNRCGWPTSDCWVFVSRERQ